MDKLIISKSKLNKEMHKKNIKTQTELAKMMNITKNQLSVILSDKFDPIKSNVEKLCNVLEVNFEDIAEKKCENQHIKKPDIDNSASIHSKDVKKELDVDSEYIDVSKVIPNRKYNVVELFAGAGGLALGLEKAGFQEIGLVEIDHNPCNTLRKNRPNWNVIEGDIIKIAEEGIKKYLPENVEIDLISGGYPCQSFSYAGHRMGLDDVRGTMFYYYSKILKELKPKMFLAENVRGLVTHDNGKTLQTMIEVFSDIGYRVTWKVLKALDYNVAQKRERIVIIGIRNDIDSSIVFKYPKPYEYKPVLRDALKGVPPSQGAKYPPKKAKVLELVPAGGCWVNLPDKVAKEYMGSSYYSGGGRRGMARRISWNEPCLTLTCAPAQKQTERCHPDETRPFTTREYARIQSFPDEWQFEGSMSSVYKQIGNAVPVELAKAVGKAIIATLNKINQKREGC
ncbi:MULTISPECIES: DNA (cytosine-5-)-methyltransferase [Clostridium]|uniref:DNA (cytosine-5-)-methyltransferase n=1 Tax=Clostridium TaxID=1485 RepID=UPI000AC4BBCF|nr:MULTISPECIES: DNA (cytosine-5-)-methyltransferase [Clostridium]